MSGPPSHARLQRAIKADGRRIAAGDRPLYHVTRSTTPDGSTVDVMVSELPIVHALVPDEARVLDGARGLIARTLGVDAASFDVVLDEP